MTTHFALSKLNWQFGAVVGGLFSSCFLFLVRVPRIKVYSAAVGSGADLQGQVLTKWVTEKKQVVDSSASLLSMVPLMPWWESLRSGQDLQTSPEPWPLWRRWRDSVSSHKSPSVKAGYLVPSKHISVVTTPCRIQALLNMFDVRVFKSLNGTLSSLRPLLAVLFLSDPSSRYFFFFFFLIITKVT